MPTLPQLIEETEEEIAGHQQTAELYRGRGDFPGAYDRAMRDLAHAEMRLTVLKAFQDAATAIREG